MGEPKQAEYFAATNGTKLWKSDGTQAITVVVKYTYPGQVV